MQVEDWEAAAKAYRKYCVYESDVSNQYRVTMVVSKYILLIIF